MKRIGRLIAVFAAIMLLQFAEPAQAGLRFVIGVRVPPPPPRRELVVGRPRLGAVWVKGHWFWSPLVGRYIWKPGMWIERRPGFIWVEHRWTHTPHGWLFIDGYWRRTRV